MIYTHIRFFSIIVVFSSFIIASCAAGSRGQIRFDDLKFPASMSAYLYGPDNEILAKDKDLKVIKKYYYRTNSWNIVYSLISFSNNGDVIEDINRAITESGGDGIVSVEVSAQDGITNSILLLNLLPFWPTYSKIIIEGDIVKFHKVSKY
jgi:hypothetical protein